MDLRLEAENLRGFHSEKIKYYETRIYLNMTVKIATLTLITYILSPPRVGCGTWGWVLALEIMVGFFCFLILLSNFRQLIIEQCFYYEYTLIAYGKEHDLETGQGIGDSGPTTRAERDDALNTGAEGDNAAAAVKAVGGATPPIKTEGDNAAPVVKVVGDATPIIETEGDAAPTTGVGGATSSIEAPPKDSDNRKRMMQKQKKLEVLEAERDYQWLRWKIFLTLLASVGFWFLIIVILAQNFNNSCKK